MNAGRRMLGHETTLLMIRAVAMNFQDSSVVKNLPANGVDWGSNPGPGIKNPHVSINLTPYFTSTSLCTLELVLQQEKPQQ